MCIILCRPRAWDRTFAALSLSTSRALDEISASWAPCSIDRSSAVNSCRGISTTGGFKEQHAKKR